MPTNDTRRLRVVVTGESEGATQALEQVGDAADQTESRLGTLTRTIAGFAGRGALALGAVGVAAATMGISTATQLEQVTVGFTTMLGSATKAQKFLKELQDFAAATPFEFTELVGSAQRFLAMGFAAKDVIPMLTAVGDAVAAMGGSAEAVDGVTMALSQMQAKGKVSGEELMQLTERGIPALKILADQYGVSTQQMSKMIEKGEVMSSKAIPLLIDGLKNGTKNVKGFGGMMEKQSATMAGKWSTFMDTLRMGLGALGTKILPTAKKAVEATSKVMTNFFAGLEGKGKLKGFTGTINEVGLGLRALWYSFKEGDVTSDGLVGKFETVGATTRMLINAFRTGKATAEGWKRELETLAIMAGELVDSIQWLIEAVGTVYDFFKENEVAAKALFITLVALTAITKAHAAATGVQAAGGLLAMFKNMALVNNVTKVGAALQWAWNGALVAWMHISYWTQLGAIAVKQKAVAVWTKVVTAAQWLWNAALTANPIGIVIVAIAAMVAAIILLWKKSDTFRNWVLGTLWPSLQKAWQQLRDGFWAAVNGIIDAWNWLKNGTINLWNTIYKAVTGFTTAVDRTITDAFNSALDAVIGVFTAIGEVIHRVGTNVVRFFMPLINAIVRIQTFVWQFYNAAWKAVWILVQIAVKVFVGWFESFVVPKIRTALNIMSILIALMRAKWEQAWRTVMIVVRGVSNWFTGTIVPSFRKAFDQLKTAMQAVGNFFTAHWNAIRFTIDKVRNWFNNTIVPSWRKAFDQLKFVLNVTKLYFIGRWVEIQNKISAVFRAVAGPVAAIFNAGLNKMRGWLSGFRNWWNSLFDGVSKKSSSSMDSVVKAFNKGRDGIKRAWDSVVAITKKPINFMVNDVYNNRIRPLWNKVAEKFGISTRLDTIQGFAKGGVVPGSGRRDTELAMLTPGEGILTIGEMNKLGGAKGFRDFRASLAQYNKGGIAGSGGRGDGLGDWFKSVANKGKDIIQGMAGPVIRPLVNAIRGVLNRGLQGGGISGLMRSGGNTMLDKLVGWVTGKDKEMPAMGSGGLSGGFRAMQALISAAFPGLGMISGFRPGSRTLSGNRSYHSLGRAVDYPAHKGLAQWIYQRFGGRSKEIITPWQQYNVHNGRSKRYTGAVWNQHNFAGGNAHVHWAMDTASTVDPGWFMGYNGTGKPETLVNADKFSKGLTIENVVIHVNGATDPKAVAKEVRDQLISLSRRNGGRAGLPTK